LQHSQVARQGSAVARNHYNALWAHICHQLQHLRLTTFAGWIKYNYIGGKPLLLQHSCGTLCVIADKMCVGNAVVFCILLCVFNCCGDNLYANQLAYLVCHRKPNGTRTAIKVEQQLVSGQPCKLRGNTVKLLCALAVYLIKRKGRDINFYAAQNIGDVVFPPQGLTGLSKDNIGFSCIAVEHNGFYRRAAGSQAFYQDITVRQFIAVYNKANHGFSGRLSFSDIYMS